MTIMTIMQQTPKMNPIVGLLCCAGLIVVAIAALLVFAHRSGRTPAKIQEQYDRAGKAGKAAKEAVVPRKSVTNGSMAIDALNTYWKKHDHPSRSATGGISATRDGRSWKVEILSSNQLQGWRYIIQSNDSKGVSGPTDFRPTIVNADQAKAAAFPRLSSQVPWQDSDVVAYRSGEFWYVTAAPHNKRQDAATAQVNRKTHVVIKITLDRQQGDKPEDDE